MPKKVLVLLGHPDANSLCGALANAYASGAKVAGHEVKLFRLGDIHFDPVLRHGYNRRQELEPGLQEIREALTSADHLVLVYPIWWGAMPALMKGFFDRVFLPGYAFKYRKDSPWWDRLLAGRSARVIVTMDTPPWYYSLVYRMPGHHQIQKTILEFSGIKPVRITALGPVRAADDVQCAAWLAQVKKLGSQSR